MAFAEKCLHHRICHPFTGFRGVHDCYACRSSPADGTAKSTWNQPGQSCLSACIILYNFDLDLELLVETLSEANLEKQADRMTSLNNTR